MCAISSQKILLYCTSEEVLQCYVFENGYVSFLPNDVDTCIQGAITYGDFFAFKYRFALSICCHQSPVISFVAIILHGSCHLKYSYMIYPIKKWKCNTKIITAATDSLEAYAIILFRYRIKIYIWSPNEESLYVRHDLISFICLSAW